MELLILLSVSYLQMQMCPLDEEEHPPHCKCIRISWIYEDTFQGV